MRRTARASWILAVSLLCCGSPLGVTRASAAEAATDCSQVADVLASWIDDLVGQEEGGSLIVYQMVSVTYGDGSSVLIQIVPSGSAGDVSGSIDDVLPLLTDALSAVFPAVFRSGTPETFLAEAIQACIDAEAAPEPETSESFLPGSWRSMW